METLHVYIPIFICLPYPTVFRNVLLYKALKQAPKTSNFYGVNSHTSTPRPLSICFAISL